MDELHCAAGTSLSDHFITYRKALRVPKSSSPCYPKSGIARRRIVSSQPFWLGDPNSTKKDSKLAELTSLVLKLQQQMLEMQQTHKQQIDELKVEIAELRKGKVASEEPEAEDEAAALRALAESMVGEEAEPEKPPEETVFKSGQLT